MALVALGCRVSRADVDALAGELGERFDVAAGGERADVVVVNTCAITADAEAAVRRAIRRAAREHAGAPIVAAGCHAEVSPDALAALPGVAAVVGARSQRAVAEAVALLCGDAGGGRRAPASAGAFPWSLAAGPARHTRAFLKVQDGCDRGCAYCVVPLARGRSRSLPAAEALRRLAVLGERHAEVVLTGVHLGAYGADLAPASSLAALVTEAVHRRAVRRLRLSSVEPGELPREILGGDFSGRVCPHFHLPLQSGSPRVLERMGRPGGDDDFRRAVEDAARGVPGACFGTDVLTGFPGETDRDHRATVALVESLPLAYLHVFPFSPRRGTRAATLDGAVPPAAVRERAAELLAISRRRWRAYLAAQAGSVLEVVVERVEGGVARGTAERYVTVRWPSSGERRGELVRVRVEGEDGEGCRGAREA